MFMPAIKRTADSRDAPWITLQSLAVIHISEGETGPQAHPWEQCQGDLSPHDDRNLVSCSVIIRSKRIRKPLIYSKLEAGLKGDLRVSLCWLPLLYRESKLSASGGREHVAGSAGGGQGTGFALDVVLCRMAKVLPWGFNFRHFDKSSLYMNSLNYISLQSHHAFFKLKNYNM